MNSRFTYEIHEAPGNKWAVIRRLMSGEVAGYDQDALSYGTQVHYQIRSSDDVAGAVGESRSYASRWVAEQVCMRANERYCSENKGKVIWNAAAGKLQRI